MRFVCPACGEEPTGRDEWVRDDLAPAGEPTPSTRQLLLTDGDAEIDDIATADGLEYMTTLRPCGHAFPREALHAVEVQLHQLNDLIERHTVSTNAFERQCLCEDIHAVGCQLEATADRCAAQMVAPPRTDNQAN